METEEKSKSQIKREMEALQKTGERLVALSFSQIKQIDIPDNLRDAVLLAKSIKKFGAKKSQLQLIGAIMRDVDSEPINKALYDIDKGHGIKTGKFHTAEKLRNDLVGGDDKLLEEIIEKYSGADRQQLRQLVRNARKEHKHNKTLKFSRLLFRHIMKLVEQGEP